MCMFCVCISIEMKRQQEQTYPQQLVNYFFFNKKGLFGTLVLTLLTTVVTNSTIT